MRFFFDFYALKFTYLEMATKFCEISTLLLTGTIKDKSKIFLNFVNNGDFDVTEESLPCLKSSRNFALNEP